MLKVLIADNHEIFRRGIKQVLFEMPGEIEVDEAVDSQDVMNKMCGDDYDAVLLDIDMHGRNGLDILRQTRNLKPDLQVLILSMYPEEQYAMSAFKAGAAAYLTKACSPDELVIAIQEVVKGKKYVSYSLAGKLASYIERDDKKVLHETLSNREYEVMCMTVAGKSAKQIAAELLLNNKTISTYRSRILNKLNVDNIAQLIQYVVQDEILYKKILLNKS